MRDGEPYRFFHKTIKDGPDIFDDHLYEPNTQMGKTGENDGEEEEMKTSVTPGEGIDQEDEELHLEEEPEAEDDNGIQAVAEDIDARNPWTGGAINLTNDTEGPRAQFVHYLTRQPNCTQKWSEGSEDRREQR